MCSTALAGYNIYGDLHVFQDDWLTPHRAALRAACRERRLDFNAADTLSMLYPDATVDELMTCLSTNNNSLEEVRLLVPFALEMPITQSCKSNGMSKPLHDA